MPDNLLKEFVLDQLGALSELRCQNPKGIPAISPELRGTRYPGSTVTNRHQP
jgi:hypothetical protein